MSVYACSDLHRQLNLWEEIMKVMVGVPDCGKSTWANKESFFLETEAASSIVVSRDKIRKSFVAEVNPNNSNDYFSKENEVFTEFIHQINEAMQISIDYGEVIYW